MPRKSIILCNESPYHVTARCNNKENFYCSIEQVWEIFLEELKNIQDDYQVRIHAFVLMSNHFHLMLSTPQGNISVVMQQLMARLTKKINLTSNRIGRVFGSRYHGSIIQNDHYYDCALKYVYRNPVKAGICNDVLEYKFSTLYWIIKKKKSQKIRLDPPFHLKSLIPDSGWTQFIEWLNKAFASESDQVIRKALRKTTFKPIRVGMKNRLFDLKSESLF